VEYASLVIDGEQWQGVQVRTDHPAVCCMAS
jgi:methenyltetrahydromethanopterin cyclohydrolase